MNAPSEKEIDQLVTSYGTDFTPQVEAGLLKVRQRITAGAQHAGARKGPAERQVAVTRPLNRRRWLAAAASVLLLVTAGYFIGFSGTTSITNTTEAPLAAELPDGTRVTLQKGAEISYARSYNDTERRIELHGQAYFQVQKDASRPFLVGTSETELRVTGTAFNLRIDGEEMEVEVAEGSVELSRQAEKVQVGVRQCGLAKAGRAPVLMPAPHLNRHAWRTGSLHFDNTPLAEVLETLRKNFRVGIVGVKDCNFEVTATYRSQDPAAILQDIAKLGGLKLRTTNDRYELTGLCSQ